MGGFTFFSRNGHEGRVKVAVGISLKSWGFIRQRTVKICMNQLLISPIPCFISLE